MKRLPTLLELIVLALVFMAPVAPLVQLASAQTPWYVATNGTGGGTSWADATNSIQGAIDASSAGDTVWVSNGLYEAGGVTNYPSGTILTNRIAIWKAITVRSANNDPTNTVIRGDWASGGTTNGPDAVRCVWMTNGSSLIGFTLTNGATLTTGTADRYGGGVSCQSVNTTISNCVLTGNSANNYSGGTYKGSLYNCTLTGNSATYGGAALYANLYNCTLTRNSAMTDGGGTYISTLYNCTLTSNSVGGAGQGGGVYGSTLFNCTLTGNTAKYGGGAYGGVLSNCTLSGNSTWNSGGGAYNCTLYNCTLTGNLVSVSGGSGGGAMGGTLYNCTIVGNKANYKGGGTSGSVLYNCTLTGNWVTDIGADGGGARDGALNNCISWGNNRVDAGGTYNYSCGVGYTNGGSVSGNITNNPLFITNGSGYGSGHVAGDYRLRNVSPARNAGTNFSWMTNSVDARSKDLDGRRRIDSGVVDMGCYEFIGDGTMFTIQ